MNTSQGQALKVGDRVTWTSDGVQGTVIARPWGRVTIKWDSPKNFTTTIWVTFVGELKNIK